MKSTIQCHKCKQQFRREELIYYATAKASTEYPYCSKCLEEVQSYERFSNAICEIFGVIAPGGQINSERKRLKENYGYTDDTIIDCLHYVYDIEKIPKQKRTLYFVNPTMIERMMKYKKSKQSSGNSLAQAMKTKFKEVVIPIKNEEEKKKPEFNFDSFFND